ncbi:YicC/YloC family endoribonuclease [Thermoanaerobacterium sp. DL9XJH110]|uniref:YicC/YloC family endoribonuclease n=1 Tax=Thermoanaerobacterium sp. DL9XJH110 TaxID=3386643 RepID=UPI003BB5D682
MIKSMTGYGRGESLDRISWVVEIRSVNHRFLEIFVKLPRPWLLLEEKIKNYIKGKITRGRIDVFVNLSCENLPVDIKIDKAMIENYYKRLLEIKEEIGFEGPVSLSLLSLMPDVFQVNENLPQERELWDSLKPALEGAVNNLLDMRAKEGENLWNDISARLDIIDNKVDIIKERADVVVEEYRKRLMQDVEKLSRGIAVDQERIEAEVVLFAERSNISEEIVRIKSHLCQMKSLAASEDALGKKMDFIAQEMFRETNTIGAKSSDYVISREIIEIKSELEKIREQIQNIE